MSWSQRLSSDLMILYCWIWKLESSMRRVDRMALRLLGSWLWPLSPLLRKADWASSPSSRRCSHQSQCIKCLTLCLLSLLSDHWAILCLHKSFLRALKWFPVTSRKCPNFFGVHWYIGLLLRKRAVSNCCSSSIRSRAAYGFFCVIFW